MKALCYGGSFNPIHHAHLICARAAAESAGFDHVVLIPGGQPPLKQELTQMAAAADRLEMCRRAISSDPFFTIDDLELRRPGKSYTIETVRALRQREQTQPDDPIHWLIGADQLHALPLWHDFEKLMSEVTFVIMQRPGWPIDWSQLPASVQHLAKQVVHAPQLDISSTEIRQRLQKGLPIHYLTPAPVCQYIQEQLLYR